MKTLLILASLLAANTGIEAQKTPSKVGQSNFELATQFESAQMTFADKKIVFSGLPYLPKNTWAYVTDAEGEVIKQHRVNPENSQIDLKHIQNGIYFVTLSYGNRGQKSFVLTIGNNR